MNGSENNSSWLTRFLIQPFWAAVLALFNAKEKGGRIVLILFTGLYGLCAVPQFGSDMYAYVHSIDNGFSMDLSDSADYLVPILSYIVSLVTHNGHILLCVFGLICGFFFAKSIQLFCESEDKCWPLYIAILLFANVYSLCTFGGVRNAIAFYVFFWGAISYVNTKELKFLYVALSSIIIHFSFMIYVGALVAGYLLKKFPKIALILFVISVFVTFSGISDIIGQYLGFLGGGIQAKGELYLEAAEDYKNYTTGLSGSYIKIAYYGCMFLCFFITLLYERINKIDNTEETFMNDTSLYHLLICTLVLFAFSNILSGVPHLSGRFSKLCVAFSIFPIFVATRRLSNRILSNSLFSMLIAILALTFVFEIRKTAEFTPISLITLPLPFTGVIDTNVWEILDSIL